LLERLFEKVGPDSLQVAAEEIAEPEVLVFTEVNCDELLT